MAFAEEKNTCQQPVSNPDNGPSSLDYYFRKKNIPRRDFFKLGSWALATVYLPLISNKGLPPIPDPYEPSPTSTETSTPTPTPEPTPTATETPRPAEMVSFVAQTEGLDSPDSESHRNWYEDTGQAEYLGDVYNRGERVAVALNMPDDAVRFVREDRVTVDQGIRREYEEVIPWRAERVVDAENSPTNRTVELEAAEEPAEGVILGSAMFRNDQDTRFEFSFTVSSISAQKVPEIPTPRSIPKVIANDTVKIEQATPEHRTGYVYIEDVTRGNFTQGKIAALVEVDGVLSLEVYHDGGRTERVFLAKTEGNVIRTGIEIQENGRLVTAYSVDDNGTRIEIGKLSRRGALTAELLRAGRGAENSHILVSYLETSAEPDFDMQEQVRLRNGNGLPEVMPRRKSGFHINHLDDLLLASPDALHVLRKELAGGILVPADTTEIFNPRVFNADLIKQLADYCKELDVELFLWLDGDPGHASSFIRDGGDYNAYIKSVLNPFKNQGVKVVIGGAIAGESYGSKYKSAGLVEQLTQAVVDSGNIVYIAGDDRNVNLIPKRVARLAGSNPNITGIIFPFEADRFENNKYKDYQKEIVEPLQEAFGDNIVFVIRTFPNQACDGCAFEDTAPTMLSVPIKSNLPFALGYDGFNDLSGEPLETPYYRTPDHGWKQIPNEPYRSQVIKYIRALQS